MQPCRKDTDHHSEFDSKTKQHKNYTIHEVKAARQSLYAAIASLGPENAQILRAREVGPEIFGVSEVWQPGCGPGLLLIAEGKILGISTH